MKLSKTRSDGRSGAPGWRGPREGFALVVTVSLMILLALLAVGLLGLSSTTLRSSGSAKAQAEARANARLALELAIAELQETAGDDRRVTADAAILGDVPRARAVGVWESWDPGFVANPRASAPDYASEKDSRFLRWLVSGDPEQRSEPAWAREAEAGDSIELFREESDGFDLAGGAVPFTNGDRTATLAWAVSQENTKAKISVDGPDEDQRIANDDLQAQPRPNLALGEHFNQPDDGWRLRSIRLTGIRQADLDEDLRKDPEPSARAAAHYTTSSAGLLTDTLRGGLKTDLSLAFEMPDGDFDTPTWSDSGERLDNPFRAGSDNLQQVPPAYADQRPLYQPLAKTGSYRTQRAFWPANVEFYFPVTAAPTFHSLRSFYRIPHHLYLSDGELTVFERENDHVAAAAGSVRRGFYPPPALTVRGERTQLGVRPVLDRAMFLISGGLSQDDKLRLILTPIVTLWNPYNVALEIEGSVAHVWIDLPYDFNWRTFNASGRLVSDDYMYLSGLMGSQFSSNEHARSINPYFYAAITADGQALPASGQAPPIRFEPGEVRVFAPASETLTTFDPLASIRERTVFLRPVDSIDQFSNRGGFLIPTFNTARQIGYDRTLDKSQYAQLYFKANVYGDEDYPFYITLEDATRARGGNPQEDDRGQAVADILANQFASSGETASFLSPRVSYAQLKKEPIPVGVLESYHRVARDSGEAQVADLVFTGNPRQPWMNPFVTSTGFRTGPQYQSRMRPVSTFNGVLQTASGGRSAYYGATQTPNGGRTHLSFFEVPGAPILSLAALQHGDFSATPFAPANQVGNSWASAYVPRSQVSRGPLNVDHCYLLNEALWDGYFFSGAAPTLQHSSRTGSPAVWDSPVADAVQPLSNVVSRFLRDPAGDPLRNPRMKLVRIPDDPDSLADRLLAPGGCLLFAGELMVDGAFNINSTSVEAWTTVLSALREASFEVAGSTESASSATPFPRFRDPVGTANDPWHGFRTLDDAAIEQLASELVDEVRARGPFLSLSEFVNRRVSNDEFGLKGALQAAIDRAGINESFLVDEFATEQYEGDSRDNIVPNDTAVGTPGYLTQADVLKPLAPVITPRSDTFIIRSYGDSRDAAGTVVARAWAEAVVQRVPDFIDPDDARHTAVDELGPVNQRFGRRFRMVSFRYLPQAELES